ncbi:G-protein coupled receptor Mth2 isoform X1 [Solenopsis invicta]|uniref:G-protein coupled receptor Mth2 isoform X1 n=1 Tax=Solenopsis invicta TaxID=13686 RepID=UPI00193E7725|nr:G-protein coupled receptor Mth2 isoform X1 [Solenopsis invicta]
MYLPSKVLWCFVLLFVTSFSEFQENSTNGDKQNDDLFISSIKYRDNEIKPTRCVSHFIKNDDEMEYEFYINSTKNESKDDTLKQYEARGRIIKNCEENTQISMESAANSTDINDSIKKIENFSSIERDFESNKYELDENESDEDESDEDESDADESDEDESDEYESDEYESDENESNEYESDEYESDEYESDEYESDEYESDEYESDEDESDEDESDEDESDEDESDEDESDEDESDEHESDEHESDKHESDEHESDKHESDEHESDKHESDKHESDEHKSDEYKSDKYFNSTNLVIIKTKSTKECLNHTCVQLCCPLYNFMKETGKCVIDKRGNYFLPKMYTYNDGPDVPSFSVTVHDPCHSQNLGKTLLPNNTYNFLINGSLYQISDEFILPTSYCLASLNRKIYEVMICNNQRMYPIYVSACLLVSLPFLLVTFVVYSIFPELQDMHSYILRAHIASLFIAYVIMYYDRQDSELQRVDDKICCITLAYILNFFLLSTFFWLNVTCFDLWWKFRGLCSYQTNIRQEKKKFIMYSIYAWGIPLIINIICAIMDYVDGIPKNWKPQICTKKFWFGENLAKTIYFYIPMSATIISNICFFIATIVSIMYPHIRTARQLRHSESKCHNENKRRFKMYLKLFIVMGISWIMEILAWSIDSVPSYIWYSTNMLNNLQGLIIFIIFVCTKKIKQQLLKRYGGQNCGPFCKIRMYNDNALSNITTTSRLRTEPNMQAMDSTNQRPTLIASSSYS